MKTEPSGPKTYLDSPLPGTLKEFAAEALRTGDIATIAAMAQEYFAANSFAIDQFPRQEGSYSRTILGRMNSGYEAMMARWSGGVVSAVHGHPAFGLYLLLAGRFEVDNYELRNGQLHQISTQVWTPGDICLIEGEQGRYDNGIHRLRTIEESLSFHVYSDNASHGECFDAA